MTEDKFNRYLMLVSYIQVEVTHLENEIVMHV